MKHEFSLSAFNVSIRPVTFEDAELIIKLRGNPEHGKHLGIVENSIDTQIQWLKKYEEIPGDFYFVIESLKGGPKGLIGLYGIKDGWGEFGRWIVEPGSSVGVGSLYLIYKFAFDNLELEGVYCRTLVENEKVVSLHNGYAINKGILKSELFINGKNRDVVRHEVTKKHYSEISDRLKKLAMFFSKMN